MDNQTDPEVKPNQSTGESQVRPAAAGAGAAGGGITGAVVGGAVGGPVGAALGAVAGGIAGAAAGQGIAEAIDPAAEDKYWRERHHEQEWADKDSTFEHFHPAYRTGYMAAGKYLDDDNPANEAEVQREYEATEAGKVVPWARARPALKAAWRRAAGIYGPRDRARGIRSGF